jgi:tetratricopeptide (TPR) repeat protein
MRKAYWCVALLVLFITVPATSQRDESLDRVDVHGTIHGLPTNTQCSAEINGIATSITHQIALCEADGSFQFKDLERGTYLLAIHIGTDEFSQTISLVLPREDLEIQVPHRNTPVGGEQTVSATELQVPDKAKQEVEKANEQVKKGDLDKADKYLLEALQIAPRFARAMTMRAMIMLARRDPASALQTVDNSVIIEPMSAMTQFVRASALNQLGRPQEAQQAAEQGLKLGPSWQGHFELSKAMVAQGQNREALGELEQAARDAPENIAEIPLLRASILLQLQDFAGAQSNLNEFTKLRPGDPRSRELQAMLNERKPAQ